MPRRGCLVLVLLASISVGAAAAPGDDDQRLIDAAKQQDLPRVRALVAQKVDPNAPQPDGATALHWAVHWDDLAMTDVLLAAGARVSVANDLGVTPLALACENGNGVIVDRLLARGADPNAAFPGRPPALMLCVRSGSVAGVKAMIARRANVNGREPLRGQTALMWAAANAQQEIVRALLVAGADVRARSQLTHLTVNRADPNDIYTGVVGEIPGGRSTPLLFAAAGGSAEITKLLLDAGADANEASPAGESALLIAVHSGHDDCATLLLQRGADPNASGAGYTALHAAVLRGSAGMVRTLLARGAGVDPRIAHGTTTIRAGRGFVLPETLVGGTPFLLAAKFLDLDIARQLVAAGADPRAGLADGTTALMLAAGLFETGPLFDRRERILVQPDTGEPAALDMVQWVLGLGGDVNSVNVRGDTALHGAAAHGYRTVVQALIARGAQVDIKNAKGATAFDVGDARVKDLLVGRGRG
ncbi:MAG TPA: ankyrin repeat domain-containing protein [Vicinamibacterales bacterium]|nr:ankyrin repeat domain-containing protein [Vicinamibacterales bacterium]